MLPVNDGALLVDETEVPEEIETSLTYGLNFDKKIITGKINEQEAIKQAILLAINTERFEYEIYSWNYGTELASLIGQEIPLIYANIEANIRETIEADDRIIDVGEFSFNPIGKTSIEVKFSINTLFGNMEIKKEVPLNG